MTTALECHSKDKATYQPKTSAYHTWLRTLSPDLCQLQPRWHTIDNGANGSAVALAKRRHTKVMTKRRHLCPSVPLSLCVYLCPTVWLATTVLHCGRGEQPKKNVEKHKRLNQNNPQNKRNAIRDEKNRPGDHNGSRLFSRVGHVLAIVARHSISHKPLIPHAFEVPYILSYPNCKSR